MFFWSEVAPLSKLLPKGLNPPPLLFQSSIFLHVFLPRFVASQLQVFSQRALPYQNSIPKFVSSSPRVCSKTALPYLIFSLSWNKRVVNWTQILGWSFGKGALSDKQTWSCTGHNFCQTILVRERHLGIRWR